MSLTILLLIMGQWLLRQRRFTVTYLLSRYKWRSSFYWDSFLNAFTLVKSAHQREWVYHAVLYTHTCTCKSCVILWIAVGHQFFFQNFKIFSESCHFLCACGNGEYLFKIYFMRTESKGMKNCPSKLYQLLYVWQDCTVHVEFGLSCSFFRLYSMSLLRVSHLMMAISLHLSWLLNIVRSSRLPSINSFWKTLVQYIKECSLSRHTVILTMHMNLFVCFFLFFLSSGGSEKFQDKQKFFYSEVKKMRGHLTRGEINVKISRHNILEEVPVAPLSLSLSISSSSLIRQCKQQDTSVPLTGTKSFILNFKEKKVQYMCMYMYIHVYYAF